MADIETYGDLKKVIQSVVKRKKASALGSNIKSKAEDIVIDGVVDALKAVLPGVGIAKHAFDLLRGTMNRLDTKKTKTWLDKLDIDDKTSEIVDDKIENRFFKFMIDRIQNRNDEDRLEDNFDMNQELTDFLNNEYPKGRYVAGIPSVNEVNKNKLNMSPKDKIKEALKAKLKQEMSSTGTGASVTPGTGEGVATKYAFGKSTNKGTPKDWKSAPSIPNRKSKAMDYKQLWENKEITTVSDITATLASDASKRLTIPKGSKVQVLVTRLPKEPNVTQLDYNGQIVNVSAGPFINQYLYKETTKPEVKENELKLGVKYDYKGDSGFISTGGSNNPENWIFLGDKGKYPYLSVKADLVPSEQQPGKYDGAFDAGMGKGHHIDEDKELEEAIGSDYQEGSSYKIDGKGDYDYKGVSKENSKYKFVDGGEIIYINPDDEKDKARVTPLNENYSRFRNETKTRTKPEQFHNAVKEVKKRVNEINRLFEYMNRLQNELRESEGGLKTKKYTENALQQIKESTKQLFLKSTKLK